MKGIVFSQFLNMVDEKYSIEICERLIDEVNLPSGGAYTTVGTYNAQEMVDLVAKLSEISSTPTTDLLKMFGNYLLKRFVVIFPEFFEQKSSIFDFLSMVETVIHLEVKKLYSDAELPFFTCANPQPDKLEMVYRSVRNLPDLAEGLILGAADHFGEKIEVKRSNLPEDSSAELFIITRLQD